MSQVTEEDLRRIITNAVADTIPKRLNLEEFVALRDRLVKDLVLVL